MPIFSRNPFRHDSDPGNRRSARPEAYGIDEDSLEDDERRSTLRRHWRLATAAGFLLLAVAFVAWLGYQATQAKSDLEEARQNVQKSKDALFKGDVEQAANWAKQARSNADSARARTDSAPWNIASAVPWLGGPLKTGQQIADVVLVAVADVLQP
ncbi:MAG: hypothetical protein QOC76_1560, partial [Mycobacterium sp.]|nr:hypothetical protein [Mycobacterium sp.]